MAGTETLPAREDLGVVAVRRQQLDRLVDRARRVIVEGRWLHGIVRTSGHIAFTLTALAMRSLISRIRH